MQSNELDGVYVDKIPYYCITKNVLSIMVKMHDPENRIKM